MQWRNGPISWLSRKAKFVPQSSCEIEVFAVVMVLKEAEFAAQVCDFVGAGLEAPSACVTDNKAACDVIKFPGASTRCQFSGRSIAPEALTEQAEEAETERPSDWYQERMDLGTLQ